MISAHIRRPRPPQIANQILSPLGPPSNIFTLFYRNTILALGSFLDTFQKIADSATNTRGATREIGACLTRIVIRHKAMEARMKTLSSALLDCLVLPLAEKMEEWRKVCPIFCPPTTSDMATNDGSFRLRATLTKSTARSTRSCGRN